MGWKAGLTPQADVSPPRIRLDKVFSGTTIDLALHNSGSGPLEVISLRTSSPVVTASAVMGPTLGPGEAGKIKVDFRSTRPERVQDQIILETNDDAHPFQVIPVEAQLQPLFLGPAALSFPGLGPGKWFAAR